MADSSKLYSVLSGLYTGINKLDSRKNTLSAALSGYTDANAVSSEFEAVSSYIDAKDSAMDARVDALEAISGQASELSGKIYNANGLSATLRSDINTNAADIDKIEASLSGWTVGTTDIKSAIVNGATTYTTFKAVEDQLGAIDTYISGTNGLQAQITANDGDISDLSAALKGYTSGDAVANKFTAVETAYAAADTALSTALVGTGNDYKNFGQVETALDAIDTKLSGITTVTGYVDGKISQYSLDKALTGVTDPNKGFKLGTDSAHNITGEVLIDNATLSTAANGNLFANLTLSAVQANGYVTKLSLVDGAGTKHGEYDITVKSILSTATYGVATENDGTKFEAGTDYLKLVFKNENNEAADPIYVSLNDLINANELSAHVSKAVSDLSGEIFGDGKLSSTLYGYITSNDADISYISGQIGSLSGLGTTGKTVEAAINEIYGDISGAFTDDKIVIGTGAGIEASEYVLGKDDDAITSSCVSSTVATEKAVNTALDLMASANSTKWEGLEDLLSNINTLNGTI